MKRRDALVVTLVLVLVVYALVMTRGTRGTAKGVAGERAALIEVDGLEWAATHPDTASLVMKRKAYTISYNERTKQPNWVAWLLTADHVDGPYSRDVTDFHEDEDVPAPRATLEDYKGSGYDRGHHCPAGDNKWDFDAMCESFLLSNMSPQNKRLNSGRWNQIEQAVRRLAAREDSIYIINGPIVRGGMGSIGRNGVTVPVGFFKVVASLRGEPWGAAFVCSNDADNPSTEDCLTTIHKVEEMTGITFFPELDSLTAVRVKSGWRLKD